MDFTIGQQTLAEALSNLYRNSNDKFEAFQNIQIEVIDENKIRLMSDNGLNRLEYTLEARNASGEPIMVNAKRFYDIVNKLKDIITFHDNIVSCGRSKIKIDYKNGTILTPITVTELEHSQINIGMLKNVIKNRLYAVETKNEHSVISNLFVNDDKIVATNGNVMSVGELQTPVYKSFLLSQSLAKEIIADFKDDETVYIAVIDDKKAILWNNQFKIESKLQTGQYPPYQQLIPLLSNGVKIKKNDFINGLEIMSIVVEFGKPIVKLIFNNNNELHIEHKDGKTVVNIENYTKDEPFEIYFNLFYLISALKSTNSDVVEMQLNETNTSPVIIKDDNDLHLIMPVQIRA